MNSFQNKTIFITGASRGIGKAIALKLAGEGANIVIAAKTDKPHPKLPGTIFTAAKEIEEAGGKALPLVVDVRSEDMVSKAVEDTIEKFGGIDILINNASAINLSGTADLKMKSYDLIHQVNTRGTFMTSQKCLPFLKKAENPHILNLSPPLNLDSKWFSTHVAYTISKYGMSMCVLGMSEELRDDKIAVNALWPRTTIATSAVANLLGGEEILKKSRSPQILADAAHFILQKDSENCTGNFFIDDEVLKSEGITDLSKYADSDDLMPDFFI